MPRKKKAVGVGEGVPENKAVDGTPNGGVDETSNSVSVQELEAEPDKSFVVIDSIAIPPFQDSKSGDAFVAEAIAALELRQQLLPALASHVVKTMQVINSQPSNLALVEPRLGGFDVEHVQELERQVRAAKLV